MTNFSFENRIDTLHLAVLSEYVKEVPVRVGALAQELGLKVSVAPLPMNISGLIQPEADGFLIKVNRFEPKERQRFTIAHEIAHFLLHRDRLGAGVVDSILYRSNLSSRLEAEANRLAADIVMPRQKVEEAMRSANSQGGQVTVDELAELFHVSKQAMGIRVGD